MQIWILCPLTKWPVDVYILKMDYNKSSYLQPGYAFGTTLFLLAFDRLDPTFKPSLMGIILKFEH